MISKITLEETNQAYNECDAACAALKDFIDNHSMSLNDKELKKMCDTLDMMRKRRASLKSRLNMMKQYGI